MVVQAGSHAHIFIYMCSEKGVAIRETVRLVEQSEHPEWDAVGVSYLGVVNSKEAIGDIFDLGEGLTFSSHFKSVGVIYGKITCTAEFQLMGRVHLVREECLANGADFSISGHGIKHIGVFHIELLWLAKLIDTALVAIKHDDEARLLQKMTHTKHCLPRSFNQPAEVGEVEGERYHTRENNEEALHLGTRNVFYVLHCRQVGVDDVGDDLLNSLSIALSSFAVEGIIAVTEIFREERKNLCLCRDVHGYGFMSSK